MSLTLLTSGDFKRVPWANGRGTTFELVRQEDANGTLLWRLSVANVIEPGPFSPLPGIDRVITLIDGAGFDLDFGGVRRSETLRLFAPLAFSGDWSTSASAVHGPSRDFNVMTARGRVTAEVEAVTAAARIETDTFAYVYAAEGRIVAKGSDTSATADRGELIRCDQAGEIDLTMEADAVALIVRLTPTG